MQYLGYIGALCRIIPVFILLTGPVFSGHSQDIFYSKEQKFSFQNSDFSVIGRSGDRIYTYAASREGYFLYAYNDSMRMTAKVALDFFPQKVAEATFISYPEGIVVLYQAVQPNRIVQYAARLDEKALLAGRPVALDSVKTSWFGGSGTFYASAVSEDKSKIMVFGLGKAKLTTILLEEDLRVLNRGEYELQRDDADMEFRQSLLDNSGRFYLTAGHKEGSKHYDKVFALYMRSPDGKQLHVQNFPLGDKYLSGAYSKLNFSNQKLYSAAFYSSKRSGNLEGICYFVYDPESGTFPVQQALAFPESVINDADVKNKKRAFNDYEVRKLILKNDGGFLLVSENAYITTRTTITPGFGYYSWYYNPAYANRATREYHFGDILILDFDKAGSLSWHRFLRKDQYSQEDGGLFSSFAMLNSGASLVFLYNNFSSNKSVIDIAAVDAGGEMQVRKFYTGNKNGDWLPRSAMQTDTKEWIVPVLNRNNLFFARVQF